MRWIVSSGLVEVKFDELIEERGKSICILIDGKKFWLPKSQVDFRGWSSIVEVPEWLAREKGLI
jgi:hypothetical protein